MMKNSNKQASNLEYQKLVERGSLIASISYVHTSIMKFNRISINKFPFLLYLSIAFRFWETDIRAARKTNRSTIRRKGTMNNRS